MHGVPAQPNTNGSRMDTNLPPIMRNDEIFVPTQVALVLLLLVPISVSSFVAQSVEDGAGSFWPSQTPTNNYEEKLNHSKRILCPGPNEAI